MELELILERELTTQRPPGGSITDIHVCQHECGKWHINIKTDSDPDIRKKMLLL